MKTSKTLRNLAESDDRIAEYEFIGEGEESPHRLWLAPGWKSASDPVGVVHFGSGRTVRECIQDSVRIPCYCEDCMS